MISRRVRGNIMISAVRNVVWQVRRCQDPIDIRLRIVNVEGRMAQWAIEERIKDNKLLVEYKLQKLLAMRSGGTVVVTQDLRYCATKSHIEVDCK